MPLRVSTKLLNEVWPRTANDKTIIFRGAARFRIFKVNHLLFAFGRGQLGAISYSAAKSLNLRRKTAEELMPLLNLIVPAEGGRQALPAFEHLQFTLRTSYWFIVQFLNSSCNQEVVISEVYHY